MIFFLAFQIFVTTLPRFSVVDKARKTFAQPQKWMWFCIRSHRTPAPGKEHRVRISLHLLISQKSLDVQKTPKTYATIELQLGVTGKIHHRCLQLFLWDFQWSLNNLAHLATTVQRFPSVAAGSSTSAWPADRIKPHPFAMHFFKRWPLSKWKDLHPPYASLCTFVPIQLHTSQWIMRPGIAFHCTEKILSTESWTKSKNVPEIHGNFAEICCPPKCPSLRCIFEEASLVSESCIHSLWEWFSIKFATQLLQEKDHLPNLHAPGPWQSIRCMLIHQFLQQFLQRKCLENRTVSCMRTNLWVGGVNQNGLIFRGAHSSFMEFQLNSKSL